MIFKNYLNWVFGTKVKVRLIRFLFKYPERGATARELARSVKCSHTSVNKTLKDMIGMNLVTVERIGSSDYLKLNKRSILRTQLEKIFVKEEIWTKKVKKSLEDYLGSKVKIKVLRILCANPTRPFSSREIARRTGASHTQILRTLGDKFIYSPPEKLKLNKKCFLYKHILKELFNKEKTILNELKGSLHIPAAIAVVLFGSVAKGEETFNSDIDLLVITDNKKEAEDIIPSKQSETTGSFGNAISAYIMTRAEYHKKEKAPFIRHLIKSKNHIHLQGELII